MGLYVGLGGRVVTVGADDDAHGHVSHYPFAKSFRPDIEVRPRDRTRIERGIMVCCAGTLAEEMIGGRRNRNGAAHDQDVAITFAAWVCGGEPEETSAYLQW